MSYKNRLFTEDLNGPYNPYEQLLGELLATVPESAGALDTVSKQEAERVYGTAAQELTMYEQALAKASERNAARAAAA